MSMVLALYPGTLIVYLQFVSSDTVTEVAPTTGFLSFFVIARTITESGRF